MKRVIVIFLAFLFFPHPVINKTYTIAEYTPHPPIYIKGNKNFTSENGVIGGNGSIDNPYVIEGWEIDARNVTGIRIERTTAYFIIRKCYIHGGGFLHNGVEFVNVRNGAIENVYCANNREGIFLVNSSKNSIENCAIYSNNIGFGIRLKNSSNNLITKCNISENWGGIRLSSHNRVRNCNISSNEYGIWTGGGFNEIKDCCFAKNKVALLVSSSSNKICNCRIFNNGGGMELSYSTNTTVCNCTFLNDGLVIRGDYMRGSTHFIHNIYNNSVNGKPILYFKNREGIIMENLNAGEIIIANCSNFVIKNVEMSNVPVCIQIFTSRNISIYSSNFSNSGEGILIFSSNGNMVEKCNFRKNKNAISILYSSANQIQNCNFSENEEGCDLVAGKNKMNECIFWRNRYGIKSFSGEHNFIQYCNFKKNEKAMFFDASHFNLIQQNNIISNDMGIYFDDSYSNKVLHNNFMRNGIDATFAIYLWYEIFSPNRWQGNYWDTWNSHFPKPVKGYVIIPYGIIPPRSFKIPWMDFDFFPSTHPNA